MMHAKSDLRPYQWRTVKALYESDGLIAVLKMGAGKSVSALTATSELIRDRHIRHALAIGPKRVMNLTWPQELADWPHVGHLRYKLLNGDPRSRLAALKPEALAARDLTLIGIDHMQWLCDELDKMPDDSPIFDLLIIDEISRLRGATSKRAYALMPHVKRFRSIWGLTGTIRPSGYEDLYRPLSIVSREKLWGRSFYRWRAERFFPEDRNAYTWAIRPDFEQRTINEASKFMLTLSDADMPTLPELNVIEHPITLPHDVRKLYKSMKRDLAISLDDGDILAASAGVATVKMAQIAAGFVYDESSTAKRLHDAKRDWISDMIEGLAGDPAIVVYEFVEELAQLQDMYGATLPYLGQGVSDKQAAKHVADWNAGKLPILAMHGASGGHGLNLQHGGSQIIWPTLTWSPELYEQTVARIVRPGQGRKCFVHVAIADDTIDEVKRNRILCKMSLQDAFRAWLKKV